MQPLVRSRTRLPKAIQATCKAGGFSRRPLHSKQRRRLFLLCVFAFCLVPLLSGMESVLLVVLPGGLPLGNLLASLVLLSANGVALNQGRGRSLFFRCSLIALAGTMVWLPLGFVLSGNPALNFSGVGGAAALFWRYTGGFACITAALLLWHVIIAWLRQIP